MSETRVEFPNRHGRSQVLARKAGDRATLIEGEAEVVPSLPALGSGGTKPAER